MLKIISHPGKYEQAEAENVRYQDKHMPFGYFEMQNFPFRSAQEDALIWETLEQLLDSLNPEEIGKRLWTTYRILDEQILTMEYTDGTTASTTIFDGRGNLITATLADAASFAAIYDKEEHLLGVVRLNSVTHKPTDPGEALRIEQTGGTVVWDRVDGVLAISRAIGDKLLKQHGVYSEATIDITNIDDLGKKCNLSREAIGKIQIIMTCDGFTDGASSDTKRSHEQFLYQSLHEIIKLNKKQPEVEIAKALAYKAKTNGSYDNISVAIQTITHNTPAFLLGVYDGHGGAEASTYVANHIGDEFKNQCILTLMAYTEQALSVEKNKRAYLRDNSQEVRDERKRRESIIGKTV
ncbi:Protein phosphatase 2C [Legionella santicrucis]|uniref:Protein phosphatase 2C n=1 Tax=Legionella santicrucis TaxID=45074 RepID=A0A0W0Z4K3_9GAMM|nr:PP2C family serine/threonine-protein phosphatase [Legionella santicrucis]KTD63670.1 Protein phosphatase 2C [Legionella santicrucis]